MKLIERPLYLNQLISLQEVDVIKILTGMRCTGKSTILKLMMNHLISQGIRENQKKQISRT